MSKEAIGLDIGTGAIKIVQLKTHKNGVRLTKAIVAELDEYPILPGEDEVTHLARVINGLIKTHNIKAKRVIPVIPRYATLINNIKLPPVHESRISQLMEYEAKQHETSFKEGTTMGYHCMNCMNGLERDVLLVIARNRRLEREIKIAQKLNLKVDAIDINSFALYNLHRFSEREDSDKVTCHIDIGAKRTDLVIHGGDTPIFTRYISIAGDHITKAIGEEFGLDFKEAESLKKKRARILIESQEAEVPEEYLRLSNAIKPVLESLINEIQKSIVYYQSMNVQKDIERYILSGGSEKLPNLRAYLEKNLGKKIEKANPFSKIDIGGHIGHDRITSHLSIATGLALRGIGEGEIKIELLPTELVRKRQFLRSLKYIIPAFMIALFLPLLYVPGIRQGIELRNQNLQMINLELTRFKKFTSRLPEIERLKGENSHLETNINHLRKLVNSSIIKQEAILEISKLLPVDITLTRVTIDPQNNVGIDGVSNTYKKIEEFISNLEKSGYFKEVKLIGANTNKSKTSQEDINFTIGLVLK